VVPVVEAAVVEVAVVPEIRGVPAAVVEAAKAVLARVQAAEAEAAAAEVVVRAAVAAQVAVAVLAVAAEAAAPLVAVAILHPRIRRSRASSRATLSKSAHGYLATRRFSYSSFQAIRSASAFLYTLPGRYPRSDPQKLSSIDNLPPFEFTHAWRS
jgi:hypothetical protein